MAYGYDSLPKAKKMIFKNVTIWTNEKEGKISGSVVIENGKIKSVIKGTKKSLKKMQLSLMEKENT